MLARWSLRSKLVGLLALVLLPVLGLAAWESMQEQRAASFRRGVVLAAATDVVNARHGQLVEASQRLLSAACVSEEVQQSIKPAAAPADINRCEGYLLRVLHQFPKQYSAAIVTDRQGVVRCSSMPTAMGMSIADREIFQSSRTARGFTIGGHIASRFAAHTVVPIGMPVRKDGEFVGVCAIGITLEALADAGASTDTVGGVGVALVDRNGVAIGGSPAAMQSLPTSAILAAAIVGGAAGFTAYGRDGALYEFRVRPVTDSKLFVVASEPLPEGLAALLGSWGALTLVILALAVALLVVWVGADQWCVRPLRHLQDFADKVARGEPSSLASATSGTSEFRAVSEGVKAMADAISSREAELRAGLEQRDHMLREIHHRVKNNLQMISSLLNLQAGEIRSPRLRRFFGDAQNRVLTLSILHRHLYERSSWSLVDFQQFISDLVRQISIGRARANRPGPRYHIRAPIMAVGPDTAIPVGLIVTEAVSILLGHDFGGVSTPEIRIEATETEGQVELRIEDNGVAASEGAPAIDGRGGFGLTLIRGLAMQLGGEAHISQRPGGATRFVVVFPAPIGDEAENA